MKKCSIHSLTHALLPPSLTPLITHVLSSSLSPSLTHSLMPFFPPSLTHSLMPSLLHSLTHSLLHSLTPSIICSLTPSLTHSFPPSLSPNPELFHGISCASFLNGCCTLCSVLIRQSQASQASLGMMSYILGKLKVYF